MIYNIPAEVRVMARQSALNLSIQVVGYAMNILIDPGYMTHTRALAAAYTNELTKRLETGEFNPRYGRGTASEYYLTRLTELVGAVEPEK